MMRRKRIVKGIVVLLLSGLFLGSVPCMAVLPAGWSFTDYGDHLIYKNSTYVNTLYWWTGSTTKQWYQSRVANSTNFTDYYLLGDWHLGDASLNTDFFPAIDATARQTDGTNHWTYKWATGVGSWYNQAVAPTFSQYNFTYSTGVWQTRGFPGTYETMNSGATPAFFIADGGIYSGPTAYQAVWKYQYDWSLNTGYWINTKAGSLMQDVAQFSYNYLTGKWQHQGANLGWFDLTATGQRAFFGFGTWSLGTGWSYYYTNDTYGGGFVGEWKFPSNTVFTYNYGTGQWRQKQANNSSPLCDLTGTGWNSHFVGDGSRFDILPGWQYAVTTVPTSTVFGNWFNTSLSLVDPQFVFDYTYTGQWKHRGFSATPVEALVNLSASTYLVRSDFVGDGLAHDLKNGFTFSYVYGTNLGQWANQLATPYTQYTYNYLLGKWQHQGVTGGLVDLTGLGVGANFYGDGTAYNLLNGFSYKYVAASTTGQWLNQSMTNLVQFTYNYSSGQWQHQGSIAGLNNLGGPTQSAVFLGDGSVTPHDLGNGWAFSYDYVNKRGDWYNNDAASALFNLLQFTYNYQPGQWQHQGLTAGMNNLGAAGLTTSFLADGAVTPHNLANGWSFTYDSVNDFGQWYNTGAGALLNLLQFAYNYETGQWQHQGLAAGMNDLGVAGLTTSFLGDGSVTPHDLANGWAYSYDYANKLGQWYNNDLLGPLFNLLQFAYNYQTGQWQHQGLTAGMNDLGAVGLTTNFLGDGSVTPHNLANGWTFAYDYVNNLGQWHNNDSVGALFNLLQFAYNYQTGQWQHQGLTAGMNNLGAVGLTTNFLGDGSVTPHNLANGWTFAYDYVNNLGQWYNNGAGALLNLKQYTYNYQSGQWQHQGLIAGMNDLGAVGLTTNFLGDGSVTPHDLANGWTFAYDYVNSLGSWYNNDGVSPLLGLLQFTYNYQSGQWQNQGLTLGLANLTGPGFSSSFIGDGTTRVLGTGWSYNYDYLAGLGQWFNNSLADLMQFTYDYAGGQWQHRGVNGGYSNLNTVALVADFIGSGAHDVGGGWTYSYLYSSPSVNNQGRWANQNPLMAGLIQFTYDYNSGQWQHKGIYGNYQNLGGVLSADFLGDGAATPHNLLNGWSYSYDHVLDRGVWYNQALTNLAQFAYDYETGQWWNQGVVPGLAILGSNHLSAAFLGDGTWHNLGTTWDFLYVNGSGTFFNQSLGQFGLQQFAYDYATGQWWNQGLSGGWSTLGSAGQTADFVGNGATINLNNGWAYGFDSVNNLGEWFNIGAGPLFNLMQFTYNYQTGQWQHQGLIAGLNDIGAAGLTSNFLGDGSVTPHDLGNGWAFSYDYVNNLGQWYNKGAGALLNLLQFTYNYQSGQWQHQGLTAGLNDLGAAGLTTSFLADGAVTPHDLANGWSFAYDSVNNLGQWHNNGAGALLNLLQFTYNYQSGQWQHQGLTGGFFNLGLTAASSKFLGNGALNDLGNGWSYRFIYPGNFGYWAISGTGAARFGYNYAIGTWYGYDSFGAAWQTLSNGGRSSNFVGGGTLTDIGGGWSFLYDYTNATGLWAISGSGAARFGYNYGSGKWSEYDPYFSTWQTLSNAGRSSRFVGNGALNDLGNGWSYRFIYSGDFGYWARSGSGAIRFGYNYGSGRWSEYDPYLSIWQTLSNAGRSSKFVGNGALNDLGNGWSFVYNYTGDTGVWAKNGSVTSRFEYNYSNGQWRNQGDFGGWALLGSIQVSSAFIGNGAWHDIKNGWAYQYASANDNGWWRNDVSGVTEYNYQYTVGQWWQYIGAWNPYGPPNSSAQFPG